MCTLVPRRRKRVARPAVLTSGVVQYADLDALEPFFLPEAFFLAAISPPGARPSRARRAAAGRLPDPTTTTTRARGPTTPARAVP